MSFHRSLLFYFFDKDKKVRVGVMVRVRGKDKKVRVGVMVRVRVRFS
jgi:hypothetical protein